MRTSKFVRFRSCTHALSVLAVLFGWLAAINCLHGGPKKPPQDPIYGPPPATSQTCPPEVYVEFKSMEASRTKVGFVEYDAISTPYRLFLTRRSQEAAAPLHIRATNDVNPTSGLAPVGSTAKLLLPGTVDMGVWCWWTNASMAHAEFLTNGVMRGASFGFTNVWNDWESANGNDSVTGVPVYPDWQPGIQAKFYGLSLCHVESALDYTPITDTGWRVETYIPNGGLPLRACLKIGEC